jgi:hypothetical protein
VRKGERHPSFVCEAATVRVLDLDGREVHSAVKSDVQMTALAPAAAGALGGLFSSPEPARYWTHFGPEAGDTI